MADLPDPEDLFWFLRIADLLNRGVTLGGIATRLKKSSTFVKETLDRVQAKFPDQPLLTQGAGSGGKSELSEVGREVLQGVYSQFLNLRSEVNRLAVAASLSLVTNNIVSPAIAEFLSSPSGEQVQFSLSLRTEMKFGNLLEDLRNAKTDIALVWGGPDRLGSIKKLKLQAEKFHESPFDLVVVSIDERLIEKINTMLKENPLSTSAPKLERRLRELLHGRKAIRLSDSQPLEGAYPTSDTGHSSSVDVDTFDAALAVLKAKAADFSIVPAFYPILDHARTRGELHFSMPIGSIQIAAIYASDRPPSEPASRLIRLVKERLATASRPVPELTEWTAIPEDLRVLTSMRYCYYIDGERESVGDTETTDCFPPYRWKWETIDWDRKKPIQARFRNVDGDEFACSMHRTTSAIVLEANVPRGCPPNTKSGQKFVSIFTQALANPLRLLGIWMTTEPRSSATYATVMSESRLKLDDLLRIQQVSYRSILSTDLGLRFEKQP